MVGAEYNISVANNENLKLTLQLKQSNVARDLTGYTVDMQLRNCPDAALPALDMTTYITVTAATGIIDIDVPKAILAALTDNHYFYDLILIETSTGDIERILYGAVKLLSGVTR